jgi:hypothetical protein
MRGGRVHESTPRKLFIVISITDRRRQSSIGQQPANIFRTGNIALAGIMKSASWPQQFRVKKVGRIWFAR